MDSGIPGFIKIWEGAVVLARSGMAHWETDLFQASLPQVVGQSLEQGGAGSHQTLNCAIHVVMPQV